MGKAIDRNFVNDWDCTSREDVFRGETRAGLLTEVVLQHLYREGRLEISETLSRCGVVWCGALFWAGPSRITENLRQF